MYFTLDTEHYWREGGRDGGLMRGLGTDHVISGPMHPMAHTNTHTHTQTDMATL